MGKKTESGMYRARVCIGKTPEGKNINKYVCAPTKAALEKKKQEVR